MGSNIIYNLYIDIYNIQYGLIGNRILFRIERSHYPVDGRFTRDLLHLPQLEISEATPPTWPEFCSEQESQLVAVSPADLQKDYEVLVNLRWGGSSLFS